MNSRFKTSRKNEHGAVLVLVAVCLTLFMLFLALTVDFGLMIQKKGQLQNVADAAALAAAQELVDEDLLTSQGNQDDDIISARNYAELYAASNIAGFDVDRNSENIESGGVLVGCIDDPMNMSSPLRTADVSNYNSVKVTASMTNEINGPLQLFFGGVTGLNNIEMNASSVATIENRILGFKLIKGETRIVALFNDIADGFGSQESYKISGFQAVKVCEAIWPNKQKQRRVYMQPAQMISSHAVVHSMAPQSSTIYALAISR